MKELFLDSSHSGHLLHSCQISLPEHMHAFIHFFISHILHMDAVPGTVLSTEETMMMETKCKPSPFLPWFKSHRYSIYLGRKTSLPGLPFRTPQVLSPDSIPSLDSIPITSGTKWHQILCLTIHMSGGNLPLSPLLVPSACFQILHIFFFAFHFTLINLF